MQWGGLHAAAAAAAAAAQRPLLWRPPQSPQGGRVPSHTSSGSGTPQTSGVGRQGRDVARPAAARLSAGSSCTIWPSSTATAPSITAAARPAVQHLPRHGMSVAPLWRRFRHVAEEPPAGRSQPAAKQALRAPPPPPRSSEAARSEGMVQTAESGEMRTPKKALYLLIVGTGCTAVLYSCTAVVSYNRILRNLLIVPYAYSADGAIF